MLPVTKAQAPLAPEAPKDRVWPQSKGKETSGGATGKEFISVRPALEREWTNVPRTVFKVLRILLSSYRKNVEQRLVGTCT